MSNPALDLPSPSLSGTPDVWSAQAAIGRQLAAWAVASIGGGLAVALAGQVRGNPAVRAFGAQNAAWGAIDLAIAGAGELGRRRRMSAVDAASDWEVQEEQRRSLRRLLLVNAGLDVGYVAVGLGGLLWGSGRVRGTALAITGHAAAIVIQGGFLLAFDTLHARALTAPGPGPAL